MESKIITQSMPKFLSASRTLPWKQAASFTFPGIQTSTPHFCAQFPSSATCIATGLEQQTTTFYANKKLPGQSPSSEVAKRYGKFDSSKGRLKRYSSMLRQCTSKLALNEGRAVHGNLIRSMVLPDSHVWVSLTSFYAKCGCLHIARQVLDETPQRDVVSWTALISGFVSKGCGYDAANLYSAMRSEDVRPNEYLLATILKACTLCLDVELGKQVHAEAVKVGLSRDLFVASGLVDCYAKCKEIQLADTVFFSMSERNAVLWNVLLNAYVVIGEGKAVLKLFSQMIEWDNKLNKFTLSIVLKGCTNSGHLKEGKVLHSIVIKSGYECEEFVTSCLVDMYSKCGMACDALQVFNGIRDPDVVAWSAIISCLDQHVSNHDAAELYKKMLLAGVKPNQYIFGSLVSAATGMENLRFGEGIHACICKWGLKNDVLVSNALFMMYIKHGFLEDAVVAFNRLVDRDVFTWTVIIDGYSKTNQPEKALKYFVEMQREGVDPNEFTLASCLNGCSHLANLEGGQQVHSMVMKAGHTGDIIVATALTDMYGKCGCMEDAKSIFKDMVVRDLVSWNAIIAAYSCHCQGENALNAYRMMIEEGFLPDDVTFLSILSVCSNMGLVEEGKKQFESMSKVYGITPSLEHFACMVNILARAGQFKEVEVFIREHQLITHALIWETVLGACKIHANVKLGETAARKLFELQPKVDSAYIFLSNIYAAKGMWDDVQKIRRLMSVEGVKKEPGCSWVGIDGQVHVFVSQDGSHPKTDQIYAKLEDLKQMLSLVGYMPKIKNVLHNIGNREKMEHLWHHSERLALSLALITTTPEKPIRIFKNLRMCEDCHEVMKNISDMTCREIVIRDIKRFHHFKLGACSCQDNW